MEIWDVAVSSLRFSLLLLFYLSLPFIFLFSKDTHSTFFQRIPLALLELIVKKQRKKSTRCPFSRLSKRRTVERIKFPFLAIASKTNQILAADMNARGWDPRPMGKCRPAMIPLCKRLTRVVTWFIRRPFRGHAFFWRGVGGGVAAIHHPATVSSGRICLFFLLSFSFSSLPDFYCHTLYIYIYTYRYTRKAL